jgi:hypothetical protein
MAEAPVDSWGVDALSEWLGANEALLPWLVVISIASALGTLVLVPVMVARVRPDYFLTKTPPPDTWSAQHPVIRVAGRVAKNFLGAALLISGILMLVLPGQGILTILIGLMLVDFPGKRRLELSIVRRRGVLRALNWIRRRAKREPLEVFEE